MNLKHTNKLVKILTITIILTAIFYFIIGYILVIVNLFELNQFLNFAAIIGGIASVLSLLSFVLSNLKKQDIENLGIEYLKDIIRKSEELKQKEIELSQKRNDLTKREKEIQALEIKKKEIENLIQKTSMVVYLQDQYNHMREGIIKIIEEKELIKAYDKLNAIELKLKALDSEIANDKNIEFLKQIMNKMGNIGRATKMSKLQDTVQRQIELFFDEDDAPMSLKF